MSAGEEFLPAWINAFALLIAEFTTPIGLCDFSKLTSLRMILLMILAYKCIVNSFTPCVARIRICCIIGNMIEATAGSYHPLTILSEEATTTFREMGFEPIVGPELETEWYNFDALNVPKDHPARDMQDTFFIKDMPEHVLRTHSTSATARALEQLAKDCSKDGDKKISGAFISIGKVFRNEATDATHEMQFYQIDGTMVGENINISNLKAILTYFYKKILGNDVEMEFRPSYFPFVEPGLEVWLKFKNEWLEVMGAGMLHPNVIKNLCMDPEKVQGFAFGGGLDRIAMVKWNIPDVRYFYQGDLRVNQF